MIALTQSLRGAIAQRARRLRQERRWTQAALADRLGLSQNRLSEIERGQGSFTAEQFLTLLRTFNVQIDTFAPPAQAASELQNALARAGATHLAEARDVLPTERLREALTVIREVLASAQSPRQVTALAPVLVNNIDGLNFAKLYADVHSVGLTGRLGWAVENTVRALAGELAKELPPRWRIRYSRTKVALEQSLSAVGRPGGGPAAVDDILDPGIASLETLLLIKAERSAISRRWRIATRIQPEEFQQALEAARGSL
ncbi:MAG: helix-turn-helix transcriptional regulator [Elusimicrobia bacterium]|nr:helix-turn-helix transcriptional regulator [Elusimicrobiota bacterium]